jgi:hypothetical protein
MGGLDPLVASVAIATGQLAFSALFGLVGLGAVGYGMLQLSRAYRIWSNDPIPAAEVHTETGVVELEGTATELEGTTTSKYTTTDCLAYSYEKKKRRHDPDPDDTDDWHTVDSGGDRVPFLVTDETGTVAVDPAGADLSINQDRISSSYNTRTYESRLDCGEQVHVYGHKHEAVEEGEQLGDHRIYVGDEAETMFRISDTSETRAILRLVGSGLVLGVVGVVFFAVGVGVGTGTIS